MITTYHADESREQAAPQRISILDPLRGFAALAVTWFHFTHGGHWLENTNEIGQWLKISGDYGWTGVDIFFVISGFVLPYALFSGGYRLRNFGTFLLKRLARLEPPYIASIAIVLALSFIGPLIPGFRGKAFEFEWPRLLSHLGYLSSFFDYSWYNVVYWTLAIELQFYLAIALLFPLFTHEKSMVRTAAISSLLLISVVSTHNDLLLKYLPLFGLGIITFQYYKNFLTGRGWWFLAIASVCYAAYTTDVPAALAGFAAAFAIAAGKTYFARMPVKNPAWIFLTWVGTLSYSLYLLHVPIGGRVVNIGGRLADGAAGQVLTLIAALAISLFSAWFLNYLVEKPSQKWSARIKFNKSPESSTLVNPVGNIRTNS